MIALIITFGCLMYWLLKETDFLRVNLMQIKKEVYMTLPSGATITQEDYNYLVSIIKPAKKIKLNETPCWYCANGHDKQHIDLGLQSYDLCECGASTVVIPKHKTLKLTASMRLARSLSSTFSQYSDANIRQTKRLIK